MLCAKEAEIRVFTASARDGTTLYVAILPRFMGKWDMVTDVTVPKIGFANGFATLSFAKLHVF